MKKLIFAAAVVAVAAALGTGLRRLHAEEKAAPAAAAKPDVEVTVVGMEYEGTKMWLPSPLIFKKGQRVRLNVLNNIKSDPNIHGFSIDEFGVKVVATRGKTETVDFTADKEGLFRLYCQLHPKHVGGQVLVLP